MIEYHGREGRVGNKKRLNLNKPSRANFRTAFLSDSEQIEAIGTKFLCRNSVSVEEIQDRHERSER